MIDLSGTVLTINTNTCLNVKSFPMCPENIRFATVIYPWLIKVLADQSLKH